MASIKFAVEWIANNDEPADGDLETMEGLMTVVLVADLFDKAPAEIARRVIKRRHALGLISEG